MTGLVLFAPHSDDEVLFAAFTLLRHAPRVVICFKSEGDYGDNHVRMEESRAALRVLRLNPDVVPWHALDQADLETMMRNYDAQFAPTEVWAPHPFTSHPQHVATAAAAANVFGDRLRTYHTYYDGEKVRIGRAVAFEPAWIALKLRALLSYASQLNHPRAHAFFLEDLREYSGDA